MTLGFAGAAWATNDVRRLIVAADTRLSLSAGTLSDAGIKTYDLGGPTAMVAAGHAVPALTAAQLTRPLVENHDRQAPDNQLGFFDTVRLASFFLRRASREQQASCLCGAVGFLKCGAPCIATMIVSPALNRVGFRKVRKSEMLIMPVGDTDGARLLLHSAEVARVTKKPVFGVAMSVLYYTCRHAGAFRSVGGALSVATCGGGEDHVSWPLTQIDGVLFLRGMDVTAYHRPNWPPPERVPYDEGWCSQQDQLLSSPGAPTPEPFGPLRWFDIDDVSKPETLFQTHDEPDLDPPAWATEDGPMK